MNALTRWTVKVSKETDTAVRSYLAEHGGKKGDLSKFIERAVRNEVLRATVEDVRTRNAHIPPKKLKAMIDEACAEVRAEYWADKRW
jgi:hypothetical protein